MLVLDELVSGYSGGAVIVDSVSLSLAAGDFVCLIGRNGAGKSTLMRSISGLQPVLSGDVAVNGRSVNSMPSKQRAQAISVVTTERVSSPGMRARDVVELGRQPYTDWSGKLSAEDQNIVTKALRVTEAEEFAPLLLDSLSDGQRQRVMIARALAQTSEILVLDEITAFLDLPGRVQIMALLKQHAKETGKVVLLSSHDLELSLELCDQIWIVHEGRLVFGTPQEIVDSGVLSRAFETAQVMFDGAQRQFRLRGMDEGPSQYDIT